MTQQFRHPVSDVCRAGLRDGVSKVVLVAAISGMLDFPSSPADAAPRDGSVVAGDATIDRRGALTEIMQHDRRVVIDWRSFDIDPAEVVRFVQPGSGAIALNRVLGDLPTDIRGALEANAHVWIVNPNGVMFHRGASVDVGGLLATTADIDNADFMAGNYVFDKPGRVDARVESHGNISFGDAGLAAFVAPGAANHGMVAGRLGTVVIAGEQTFTVDLAGDGLFAFAFDGPAGNGHASSAGTISNDGGYILITARSAARIVDSAVSVDGIVAADTVEKRNGRIVLSAGGGRASVGGRLSVTGDDAGETGGSIAVEGRQVELRDSARVDAFGMGGGGEALFGGGLKGQGPIANAETTIIRAGATIDVSATNSGDGGTAVVWGDEAAGFYGDVAAHGGPQGGDGGFVEVSAGGFVDVRGRFDGSAPAGSAGTLLIDPDDIVIQAGIGGDTDSTDEPDGTPDITFDEAAKDAPPPPGRTTLDPAYIETAGGNLILEAINDITVNSDVNSNAGDLTLRAGNDINIGSGAFTDVELNVNANDLTLTADADFGVPAPSDGDGTVVFNAGGSITGNGISITAAEGVMLGTVTAGGTLDVAAGGSITQTAGEAVIADGEAELVAETGADRFDIALNEGTNDFRGSVTATGGDITIADLGALNATVDADGNTDPTIGTDGGDAVLSSGDVTVDGSTEGDLTAGAGTGRVVFGEGDLSVGNDLTATATTSVEDTPGQSVTVNRETTLVAGTDIVLDNDRDMAGAHDFSAPAVDADNDDLESVNADGVNVTLNDTDGIRLGTVTAGGTLDVAAGGSITQTAGEAVIADGEAELVAETGADRFDIALNEGTNDFRGSVTATGGDITIADLGALNATVDADGNTDPTIGTDGGDAVLSSGDVTVDGSTEGDLTAGAGTGRVVFGEGDLSVGNDLTATATTSVEDTPGQSVTVNRETTLVAGTDIVLDNDRDMAGAHDFSAPAVDADNDDLESVNADGVNVTLNDTDGIRLGTVTAGGTLDVAAGGSITQTAGEAVIADGEAELVAETGADRFDIALNEGTNDFRGSVTATGGDITIADLGALNATVDADGNTDPTIGTDGGDAVLSSGDVTVDGSTEGDLTAGAGTGRVVFGEGDLSVGNDLTATATTSVEDTPGQSVTVNRETTLVAGTDIVLDNDRDMAGAHDFSAPAVDADNDDLESVNADGVNVTLNDTDGIRLGTVTAGGTLDVAAGGSITQTAGEAVIADGEAELVAETGADRFDIALNEGTNDFRGSVTATGGDITIADLGALNATVDADGNTDPTIGTDGGDAVLSSGDVTVDGSTEGDLTAGAGTGRVVFGEGDLSVGNDLTATATTSVEDTPGQSVTVNRETTLVAGTDIVLDNDRDMAGAHDFSAPAVDADNDDLESVNADGVNVTLNDTDGIRLGTVTAGGTLDVAAGGSITQTAGEAVIADGEAELVAETGADRFDIALNEGTNDFRGSVTATGGDITIADLGALNATVDADGNTDPTIGTDGGDAVLSSGDVTVDGSTEGDLTAGAGTGRVVFGEGDLSVGNDLTATATTSVEDTPGQSVTVNRETTLVAGTDIVLDNDRDMAGAHDFSAPAVDADNDDLESVNADGVNVTLNDTDGIRLGTVTAGGTLDVAAGGSITQTAGEAVIADGEAELVAETGADRFDIALNEGTNDFRGSVTATGGDITIADLGALNATVDADGNTDPTIGTDGGDAVLSSGDVTVDGSTEGDLTAGAGTGRVVFGEGDLSVGNDLTATATTSVEDTPGQSVTVNRETTLVAGTDIVLDNDRDMAGAHDFSAPAVDADNDDLESVNADGVNVTLNDTDGIRLGTVTAGGTLDVAAGGSITQTAGEAVIADGEAELVAETGADRFDIALNEGTNDFRGSVTATGGDIHLAETNEIVLADIDARNGTDATISTFDSTLPASGDLSVEAGGSITQSGGTAITTTGRALFQAIPGSPIVLDGPNDFGFVSALDGVPGTVFVNDAASLVLNDINDLEIGGIADVSGAVGITAGGSVKLRDMSVAGARFSDRTGYLIGNGQRWQLTANAGDVRIEDALDAENATAVSSVEITALGDGDVRFQDVLGGTDALDEVAITEAQDVILGLNVAKDTGDAIADDEFLVGAESDVFFSRRFTLDNVDGEILMPLDPAVESGFDLDGAYFGVNIGDPLGLDYSGSTPTRIDLFGLIDDTRLKPAGLLPIGPRSGTSEFNNCLIGDTGTCSQINSVPLPPVREVEPDLIFTPREARIDELFLGFGNEELWTLPSVFGEDYIIDEEGEGQ